MHGNRIFWALELLLMATPSLFPQLPIPVALGMYALAAVLLMLAAMDLLRSRGWVAPNALSKLLTLGPLSPGRSDLMTLVELRDLAAKQGWNMGSLHVLDFLRALDEAGKRGLLRFYGRWNADKTAEFLLRDRARELVPEAEWQNPKVSPDSVMNYDNKDNIRTALIRQRPLGERVYSDIHFEPSVARRWLRTHARQFRGQHEAEQE